MAKKNCYKIKVDDGTIPTNDCQMEPASDNNGNVSGIWLHTYVPSELIDQLPMRLRKPATLLVFDVYGKTVQ